MGRASRAFAQAQGRRAERVCYERNDEYGWLLRCVCVCVGRREQGRMKAPPSKTKTKTKSTECLNERRQTTHVYSHTSAVLCMWRRCVGLRVVIERVSVWNPNLDGLGVVSTRGAPPVEHPWLIGVLQKDGSLSFLYRALRCVTCPPTQLCVFKWLVLELHPRSSSSSSLTWPCPNPRAPSTAPPAHPPPGRPPGAAPSPPPPSSCRVARQGLPTGNPPRPSRGVWSHLTGAWRRGCGCTTTATRARVRQRVSRGAGG